MWIVSGVGLVAELACSRPSARSLRPIAGSTAISPPATRSQTAGVCAVPGAVKRQKVAGSTAA